MESEKEILKRVRRNAIKSRPAMIALLAVLSFTAYGCRNSVAPPPPPPPYEAGLDSITVERSRLYVETLAADSLEGRRAGTPGSAAAAELIAGWLMESGVVPFRGSSYFQIFDAEQLSELGVSRRMPQGVGVRNILGMIEGENPEEFVFVGAHYDHIGLFSDWPGDVKIFNGADDNASGVAGVLQIARAFAASGGKPQRTVVFALWDAEEMGLVGSRCFGASFDGMDKIRAYFNLDMIGRDESGGGGRTAWFSNDSIPYARIVCEDTARYGLRVEPVTDPDSLSSNFRQMVFMMDVEGRREAILPGNSDYVAFQRADVPVYMASTGSHPDYHRPSDEAEKIDLQKVTDISKMAFLTLYRLANPDAEIVYPAGEETPGRESAATE